MKIRTAIWLTASSLVVIFTASVRLVGWAIPTLSLLTLLGVAGAVWFRPIRDFVTKTKAWEWIRKIDAHKLVEHAKKMFRCGGGGSGDREYGFYLSPLTSTLVCLGGITATIAVVTAGFLWLTNSWSIQFKVGNAQYALSWFPLLLLLTVIYVASSIRVVKEDENGVKTFLGLMFEDVGPGPTFVPRWVCKLIVFTSKVITLAGGTPEKVKAAERGETLGVEASEQFVQSRLVRSEEELRIAGGTVRVSEEATRVTFADGNTAIYFTDIDKNVFEKDPNPLSSQQTTDPKIVVSILIPKTGVRKVVRRFGKPFDALREIDELMTSHLQILCSRVTNAYFIYRIDDFALMLHLVLETMLGDPDIISSGPSGKRITDCLDALKISIESIKTLGNCGVNVKSVRIETGLPKTVNVALKENVKAAIEVQTAERKAEAQKITLTQTGEGTAAATRAVKIAEAEGIRATKLAEADGKRAELLAEAAGKEAILKAEATGRKALIKATDSPMGRLLAQLEMLQTSLQSNSKIVITPGGQGDILGTIVSLKETLKQLDDQDKASSGPTPTPTPTTT